MIDIANDIDQSVFDIYDFSTNDETWINAIADINLQYVAESCQASHEQKTKNIILFQKKVRRQPSSQTDENLENFIIISS